MPKPSRLLYLFAAMLLLAAHLSLSAQDEPQPCMETFRSPDGQYVVCMKPGAGYETWLVIRATDGAADYFGAPYHYGSFFGWSPDSRYAALTTENQYGNVYLSVFDAVTWQVVQLYQDCWSFVMETCTASIPRAFSPLTSHLLVQSGQIYNLADGTSTWLGSPLPGYISAARWSDDERLLVTYAVSATTTEMSLWTGDGGRFIARFTFP